MMKVGIVTTWFERGAAYVSKLFKENLELQGFEVIIYARGGEKYAIGDPNWDTKEVTWGKKVNFPVESYVDNKCFCNWLDSEMPDVVIFNEQRWFDPIFSCRERNIKVGAYVDFYTEEMIPTFKVYDFLICNTKKHLSAFEWHEQAYYVPWGTDINLFKPKLSENEQIHYFHPAGMNPFRKGTDLAILAFQDLVSQGIENVKLIVHSQVSSLDLFFKKSKQCHNYELISDAIEYLTRKGHLEVIHKTVSAPGLYYLGDVYVYPSRLDGLGLTVAEAISSGLPTIVPNDGPMNEFITDASGKVSDIDLMYSRTDGYYWPQNRCSISSLTETLKEYALMSKGDLIKCKRNARFFAENNLNAKDNFKVLKDILSDSKVIFLDEDSYRSIKFFYPKKYRILDKFSFFYGLYKR